MDLSWCYFHLLEEDSYWAIVATLIWHLSSPSAAQALLIIVELALPNFWAFGEGCVLHFWLHWQKHPETEKNFWFLIKRILSTPHNHYPPLVVDCEEGKSTNLLSLISFLTTCCSRSLQSQWETNFQVVNRVCQPQCGVATSHILTITWLSLISFLAFFELYQELSGIDTIECIVGEVNDNWLTKGLASRFDVYRDWKIWLRCFLKSEVEAKDVYKEIILTLHLLVLEQSPLISSIKQQIVNLCSPDFWILFNLWILLVVDSNLPKPRDYMEDRVLPSTWALTSRYFPVPL